MTIVQLKYAIAVAEHRNFTIAAEKCFVTQPTLSMQIQKLEGELDITIFDRSKKPIAMTEVGVKIIQQCKKIVSESEKMQDVVDQDRGIIGGNFKLGVVPTIMPTLLPIFLNELVDKFPMLKVSFFELPTSELIDQLKNNRLDLVIASTPLEDDDLIENVRLFDVYTGKGIEKGKKSLAIEVMLQPRKETLTEEQIDDVIQKIVLAITNKTGGVLRS